MTEVSNKLSISQEELPVFNELKSENPTDTKISSLQERFKQLDEKVQNREQSTQRLTGQEALSGRQVRHIHSMIQEYKEKGGLKNYIAASVITLVRPLFQLKATYKKWQSHREVEKLNKLITEEKQIIKSVQYFREAKKFLENLKDDPSDFDKKIENFVGKEDADERFTSLVEQILSSEPKGEVKRTTSLAWFADWYLDQTAKGRTPKALLGIKEQLIDILKAKLNPSEVRQQRILKHIEKGGKVTDLIQALEAGLNEFDAAELNKQGKVYAFYARETLEVAEKHFADDPSLQADIKEAKAIINNPSSLIHRYQKKKERT